jgi:hypothetical protein
VIGAISDSSSEAGRFAAEVRNCSRIDAARFPRGLGVEEVELSRTLL